MTHLHEKRVFAAESKPEMSLLVATERWREIAQVAIVVASEARLRLPMCDASITTTSPAPGARFGGFPGVSRKRHAGHVGVLNLIKISGPLSMHLVTLLFLIKYKYR